MTPEEIKAERQRMNLTINEMAELICVSPRAYAYYEAGQRKIPLPVQKLLLFIAKMDEKHGMIALEKPTD
jgi:transcriptional regulator with XRE-family HTH domain